MIDDLKRALEAAALEISNPSTAAIVIAVLVSVVATLLVYVAYYVFYPFRESGSQIHRAFFLIGPSTTALFIAIQFSLPLSLGLLGALSFIRFRTPIKDPEESAYVLCLIATSIAAATFNYLLVVLVVALVFLLSLGRRVVFARFFRELMHGHVMIVTKVEGVHESALARSLSEHLGGLRLVSASKVDDTMHLHYTFGARDFDRSAVLERLRTIEGIVRFEIVVGADAV
jgi:hypothetical protein